MPNDRLLTAAEVLATRLRTTGRRLVLAESCTGGLAAATLTRIPGISEFFCGSAVVYRNATKTSWLGVSADRLNDPQIGPVSASTAEDMARGALAMTGEAELAGSVTGHLGPDAPDGLDGVIFVGVAQRGRNDDVRVSAQQYVLDGTGASPEEIRHRRQCAAACCLLEALADVLRPG